ncbi:putative calmodulin [Besnoitia besnoiti]|uniref:Calmodulin n=1 Tax=Besnoitia besnoiti TaxID=94643 RepID=A0A2A9M0U1_BESBE|nr:putative calmodulin [Besnoitia besnoiti]PFH31595.1 putative calmodulin [Besnoitia besnoiti]
MSISEDRIRETFIVFDRDGDGELALPEAVLAVRACGIPVHSRDLDDLPAKVDFRTFREWLLKRAAVTDPHNELVKLFEKFDRKRDGTVSTQEVAQVMKTLSAAISEEEVNAFIREADPNQSGRINYAAFVDKILE